MANARAIVIAAGAGLLTACQAVNGGAALAATPMCRNGSFAATYDAASLRLATVIEKASLYGDFPEGCPAAGERCRQTGKTGIVAAGHTVIVAPEMSNGWVCAYVPPGGNNRFDTRTYVAAATSHPKAR